MAFVDIYGLVTPPIKQGIKVQSLDEYSSLIFTLSKQGDTHFVVELLNQQGDPVKRTTAIDGRLSRLEDYIARRDFTRCVEQDMTNDTTAQYRESTQDGNSLPLLIKKKKTI